MGGKKILITVSEEQYKVLEREAEMRGLSRVSVLVKSEVVKSILNRLEPNGNKKSLSVEVTNYHELSDYVESKKFGSIESFATFAMAQYMTKYPAKTREKAELEN